MKVGAFDHLDASGRPLQQHYEERLTLAERYDAAGLHAYHLAEHHATPLGMAPSPSVFLAALAQRTTRLRFGPTVYCLPFYNPIRLYEEICMLDQMSGGRLEFGVGRGISPIEARYMGYDPDALPAMMNEALALILKACEGGELSFSGAHYSVEAMPVEMAPLQRPHPPLWYGVGYPEAAERTARLGANFITNLPAGRVRALTDAYRAACSSAGDMPLIGMSRHIVVAERESDAVQAATAAYAMWRDSFMKLWWAHDGLAKVCEREGDLAAALRALEQAAKILWALDEKDKGGKKDNYQNEREAIERRRSTLEARLSKNAPP